MGANTNIEWAKHTFNPWRGCTKVSEGCKFCYADKGSRRNPKVLGIWGKSGTRVIAAESYWRQLPAWDAAAKAAGERHRVFCASLADVGEGPETMPEEAWEPVQSARARLSKSILSCANLNFLLLTKRPENMPKYFGREVLERSWVGTSIENSEVLHRADTLKSFPSKIKFLSIEPLLDELPTLGEHLDGIDWVIVGGESGPDARPMHPEHARQIRDQCESHGVAFFFKQWGEFVPYESDAQPPFMTSQHGDSIDGHRLPVNLSDSCNELIDGWWLDETIQLYRKVGKKSAGRLLDGREWNEFPAPPQKGPVAQ